VEYKAELNRYLTIFVWFVFHGVYLSLSESERVVGYVEPLTQAGIDLGYFAMVGGTLVLAALAAWSGFHSIRLLLRRPR
jgi:hypothetical protein